MGLDGKEPIGGLGNTLKVVSFILGIGVIVFIAGRVIAGIRFLGKNYGIPSIIGVILIMILLVWLIDRTND
ncbi:hypothetical protein [uncultured Polaribacter sp.]|uniref:hypothetical protein n=1 Tax=uncultured Polaribacter sp. TaxID=174711 RepID=UPI002608D6DA|nr:hypothetical protein [uncultured Polaribacter sp.]